MDKAVGARSDCKHAKVDLTLHSPQTPCTCRAPSRTAYIDWSGKDIRTFQRTAETLDKDQTSRVSQLILGLQPPLSIPIFE